MPEKHLRSSQRKKIQSWLHANATLIERGWYGTEGWVVGEDNEPVYLHRKSRNSDEEADVYYPNSLSSRLSESGVVFPKSITVEQDARSEPSVDT